jgi:dTDP-4-amino-4,6-dideoxygalactose transaminase
MARTAQTDSAAAKDSADIEHGRAIMQVPLLDLKAQYATLRDEMMSAVEAVLESQYFINGPAVRELESAVAAYSDCRGAVGVSSGTDALLCSLMSLGIGPGDEVITTPFTFFATAGSIWRVCARPVFVDVEPDTFNIDPAKIEAAVTDKTKAIMPVHLFGQTADMDPILAVAKKHGLAVIEDGAQAIGATYKGRKAGSMGTVGCFSFFPSKNLGGLGDGGMITTQDDELAGRLAQCRNHGQGATYIHTFVGANFRLDTIQAAGLLVKLKYLSRWSSGRRANAARYDELLADVAEVVTPTVRDGNVSIYNQYVIRVPRRDELHAHLREQGIGAAVYYPLSLHQQQCFAELGGKAGDFPVSEKAASEVLALPVFPELTDEQIVYVAETIKSFLAG